MKKSKNLIPLLALAALVLATLACGGSSTGTKVGESSGSSATSAPPKVEVFKVGDIVEVGKHTIVLNSVEVKNGVVHANFTVENKDSSDLAMSSMLSFTAKDNEGTKLEQEIFDCGTSGLDGKVLPGDKLKGDICYKGATSFPVKIYYEASLFGSGAVVWEVNQ